MHTFWLQYFAGGSVREWWGAEWKGYEPRASSASIVSFCALFEKPQQFFWWQRGIIWEDIVEPYLKNIITFQCSRTSEYCSAYFALNQNYRHLKSYRAAINVSQKSLLSLALFIKPKVVFEHVCNFYAL